MKGLKIEFTSGANSINTTTSVSDLDATIQNALVNVATRVASDAIFPEKGTSLLLNALRGKIVGINDAVHESQIAAINTLFFSRDYDINEPTTTRLGDIKMEPITYDGRFLFITAAFTDQAKTRTVGTTTAL